MLNERFFAPMTDTEACIALNMVSGVGPIRMRRLMEAFGSPQKILGANSTQLRKVEGIGAEVADAISSRESAIDLGAELALMEKHGARVSSPRPTPNTPNRSAKSTIRRSFSIL